MLAVGVLAESDKQPSLATEDEGTCFDFSIRRVCLLLPTELLNEQNLGGYPVPSPGRATPRFQQTELIVRVT